MRYDRSRTNEMSRFYEDEGDGYVFGETGASGFRSTFLADGPHWGGVAVASGVGLAINPVSGSNGDIRIPDLAPSDEMANYAGPGLSDHPSDSVSPGPMSIFGDRFWQGIAPNFETTDADETTSTAYSLSIGQSFYGRISSGTDEDWIAVTLVAGQTYEFRMLGMGANFIPDPLVNLYNSTGVFLTSNDDSFTSGSNTHETDSRLIFTASSSGVHYISADGFSTSVGDYLLSVTPHNPNGMVLTTDEIAWQLINNSSAFFSSPEAARFNVGPDNSLSVNITALTSDGQFLARQAMLAWSAVTNITFTETTGTAEITFDDNQSGAFAQPTYSGGAIISSTVNVGADWLTDFGTTLNSYSFETYIHEIGHALGLGHGGNYNGSAAYGTDNFYLNDSTAWSIMSYMQADNDEFDFGGANDWNTFMDASFRYMVTPMIADIVAIQYLYGVSSEFSGNTTWGFGSNTGVTAIDTAVDLGALMAMTIYDTGGTDMLNLSQTSEAQFISLVAESMSSVLGGRHNLSIARGVTIENAMGGSGADRIIGNSADNNLGGGNGNDVLFGRAGGDVLDGGAGNDVLVGGGGGDYLVGGTGADRFAWTAASDSPTGGTGFDAVADFQSGSDVLDFSFDGARVFIQRSGSDSFVYFGQQPGGAFNGVVQVVGTVQGGDITSGGPGVYLYGQNGVVDDLRGGAGSDVIVGFSGADVIRGGGGSDALYGGSGADTFVFSAVSDSTLAAYDAIGDFTSGSDRIDLSALVAAGQTNIALFRFGGSTFVYFGEAGQPGFSGAVVSNGAVQGGDLILGATMGISLYGSSGVDNLRGGVGDDIIRGGDGADLIVGGNGADSLFGGAGADVFDYNTNNHSTATAFDTIQDFQVGVDRIDLSDVASAVVLSSFGGSTFIYYNPNGSGGFNGLIVAHGVTLTQADVLVIGESAPGLDTKDEGPLTLPSLGSDDPLILPVGFEGKAEAVIDHLDPLILPRGFEGKIDEDHAPEICPPGDGFGTGAVSPHSFDDSFRLALIEDIRTGLHVGQAGGWSWAF